MLTIVDRIPHGHRRVPWPLPNVWLGVSTERQKEADERIPDLLATPAAVRFISAEPLLGPIDLTDIPWPKGRPTFPETDDVSESRSALRLIEGTKLDWVIVGGESGPGARPMHPDWARSLRDQSAAAGVPFFFKQWGAWKNGSDFAQDAMAVLSDGRVISPTQTAMSAADREQPVMAQNPTMMRRVGKAAAGRELDGVTHDGMPEAMR
jgi:protein gp37